MNIHPQKTASANPSITSGSVSSSRAALVGNQVDVPPPRLKPWGPGHTDVGAYRADPVFHFRSAAIVIYRGPGMSLRTQVAPSLFGVVTGGWMGVGQDRWLRMSRALASGHPTAKGLCSACADELLVTGAGITLIAAGGAQVAMCASSPTVSRLAELEFTLGEGPAMDAHLRGTPVLESDLLHAPPARWAAFTGPAVGAGIGAIFAFPLRLGAARLGALIVYQDHPGPLSEETYADALVAVEVITRAIVSRQAGIPEEELLAELGDNGAFRAQVHQASGMVSAQLDISVGDALARLRARAFAVDRPIGEVAADVVSRRLRFDE